jgi:hypothetical protein
VKWADREVVAPDYEVLSNGQYVHEAQGSRHLCKHLYSFVGPPEKGKSTAAQLVSAIETR